jgi:hypothetical protein
LRISPRIIEERTVLIERMAADASSNGRLAAENDLRKKVDELRGYAELVRSVVL